LISPLFSEQNTYFDAFEFLLIYGGI